MNSMNNSVRVRFAPSPTGPLHIGGVRTALYNYLFAHHNQGKFILRIEDTDQSRFVKGAEEYILESLDWLGIVPDEGYLGEGPFQPYRQSERQQIYIQYAQQLLDNNKAYYAFDTPEELESMRVRLKAEGVDMPQYNCDSRVTMKNSLTMSAEEVQEKIRGGEKYVVRLMVPKEGMVTFTDMIRGTVSVASNTIDDKILIKSDGLPTYHLANVVDDHLMEISHVIRGEEWLPSAPLHVLLYRFLGWEETMPQFAHLPLLLKPEGTGKLSKRDGDKHGFPVFPVEWRDPVTGDVSSGFREKGYLPQAMVNFLALLGWNPGTEKELFKMEELIKEFSIERVNKGGARFDIEKANWFNQQYIKKLPDSELGGYLMDSLAGLGMKTDPLYTTRVASAFRERITFLYELPEMSRYFFQRPEKYDETVIRKRWTSVNVEFLKNYVQELSETLDIFDGETAKQLIQKVTDTMGIPMGSVMQVLRVAVSGESSGIDLMYTLELLGQTEVKERIEIAIDTLADQVK